MNLTIQSFPLSQATKLLSKFAEEVPVCQMTATQYALYITTSNPASRLSFNIPATVTNPGAVFTSIRRLDAFAASATDTIDIEQESPATVTVKGKGFSGKLPLIDSKYYIPPRKLAEGTAQSVIDPKAFITAVEMAEPVLRKDAADWTSAFYIETGKGEGVVVGSDRAQMICRRFPCEGDEIKFLIPRGLFIQIIRLAEQPITLSCDGSTARFQTDTFLADFQLVAQVAPPSRSIALQLFRNAAGSAKIPVQTLTTALDMAEKIGEKDIKFYSYLDISSTGVRLRMNGERVDVLDCQLGGSGSLDSRFYFDYTRLNTIVRHLRLIGLLTDEIIFRYNTPKEPLFIPISPDEQDIYCLSSQTPPQVENT